MHTKDKLAVELSKIDQLDLAAKAAAGYYDDFLSPLALPCMQLVADLAKAGTPAALALRQRAMDGEFDCSKEESEAWAKSEEGQAAFAQLVRKGGP